MALVVMVSLIALLLGFSHIQQQSIWIDGRKNPLGIFDIGVRDT